MAAVKRNASFDTGITSFKLAKLSAPSAANGDGLGTEDSFNRMKVCVRVRPLSSKEEEAGTKKIIDVFDDKSLVFDPVVYEDTTNKYVYHGKVYKEVGKKGNKNLPFNFDRVFDDSETNLSVYQETTKEMVNSLIDGYNCSVFAYGCTGSGKTHTMLGSTDDPGVIFFTTMDLFNKLEEEANNNLEISISYFEIYNETIFDLLYPSTQPLSLLEDAKKSISVRNLSVHQPKDAAHLIEMLEYGNQNRKQHPTDANKDSSRSHAVFQITLKKKEFSNCREVSIQLSKMSLIDLAGSERATVAYKTYRNQGLSREGANINKSLLALAQCITALTNKKSSNGYIPYRSSKLTLILRDSLGGNCRTLMIATLSPSFQRYEETYNTLQYAERSKGVQLNVRKNNTQLAIQPRDYSGLLDKKMAEIAQLRKTIQELESENAKLKEPSRERIVSSGGAVTSLNSVYNILEDLFKQKVELRSKLADCEHKLNMLDVSLNSYDIVCDTTFKYSFQMNLLFKKIDQDRVSALETGTVGAIATDSSNPGQFHNLHTQKLHYSNLKQELIAKVEENESQILSLETKLMEQTNGDIVIKSYFDGNRSRARDKVNDHKQKHLTKALEEFVQKFQFIQEINAESVNLNYIFYHVLNGLGHLSEESESKFNDLIGKFKGKKSVVWNDKIGTPKKNQTKQLISLLQLSSSDEIATTTPIDKHSLVYIRDITPNIMASMKQNGGNTPLRDLSTNVLQPTTFNNPNNTFTRSSNPYKSFNKSAAENRPKLRNFSNFTQRRQFKN